jgi:hypothetical protein
MIISNNLENIEGCYPDIKAPKDINNSSINNIASIAKNCRSNKYDIKIKKDSDKSFNKNIFNENSICNTKNINPNNKIEYAEYEINYISFNEAQEEDTRTFYQFYKSLIKQKHFLIYSFHPIKDYNPYIIKICLFFFSIAFILFINALFFNDNKMHRIYSDKGVFNLKFNLPHAIYSFIITSNIFNILRKIFLPQQNILEIKYEKNKYKIRGRTIMVLRLLIIKFVCFFTFSIISLILFWYYLSCFCAIYKNTQLYLIIVSLISFFISIIVPFIFYLIPGVFRLLSLRKPGECLYKISQLLQVI